MAKESGRNLGKTYVGDAWQGEVWGSLGGESFLEG